MMEKMYAEVQAQQAKIMLNAFMDSLWETAFYRE